MLMLCTCVHTVCEVSLWKNPAEHKTDSEDKQYQTHFNLTLMKL